jgi:hypothetical protein
MLDRHGQALSFEGTTLFNRHCYSTREACL